MLESLRAEIFSIHGLRVEPDSPLSGIDMARRVFQSTGSVWSPTPAVSRDTYKRIFSIHGLRVEPDSGFSKVFWPQIIFNPRAPCGARRR